MDIRKYFCEWNFSDDFIGQIETFAIWTDEYHSGNALIITKKHEAYAAGSIIDDCSENSSSVNSNSKTDNYEPVKLSLLSGERIKKFVYAHDLIFICTERGEVFGFRNSLDRIENKIISPQKVSSLLGLKVVDIAIGPNKQHLALCDDGKLYRFEFDNEVRYPIDTSTVDAKPTNIFHVTRRDCISLLENGEVIIFKSEVKNHEGVLKVVIGDAAFLLGEDNNCEKDRCEVMCFRKAGDLVDHSKIKKLITGYDYALALDESGRLFGTGDNEEGQLGIELEPSIKHYENWELNSSITEKIVDIAASSANACALSAALTVTGKIYIWGEGRGPEIRKPKLTPFESLHEVFYHYSTHVETYKPINVDELLPGPGASKDARLVDSFKKAFDDPKFCDLFVVVEGKTIPVHKSILAVRCEHFTEVFQKDGSIEKPSVLEIEDGDFKVYKAFLKYVYTDEIDDTLSFNEIIELLNLSNKYGMKLLAERCVSLVQTSITVDNVVSLYERVIEMSKVTKMENVFDQFKESCVKFAADNFFAMGVSDEFAQLNEKMIKELVLEVCKQKSKQ